MHDRDAADVGHHPHGFDIFKRDVERRRGAGRKLPRLEDRANSGLLVDQRQDHFGAGGRKVDPRLVLIGRGAEQFDFLFKTDRIEFHGFPLMRPSGPVVIDECLSILRASQVPLGVLAVISSSGRS